MTTQTLRGMIGSGAMHWRGDRSNPPGTAGSAFDESHLVQQLQRRLPRPGRPRQRARPRRTCRSSPTSRSQIMLPPNPIRALDNSLTPAQQSGRRLLPRPAPVRRHRRDVLRPAARLHLRGLPPPAAGARALRHRRRARASRTRSRSSRSRTCATSTRRSACSACSTSRASTPLNLPLQGPQIRGFGFLHDGIVDTLFRFFNATVFRNDSVGGANVGFQNNTQRRDVEQFMLAFDTNLAPVVGQQITLDATNARRRRPAHRPARRARRGQRVRPDRQGQRRRRGARLDARRRRRSSCSDRASEAPSSDARSARAGRRAPARS